MVARKVAEIARRDFVREVQQQGGSVKLSGDGHLKVFDREGRFIYKARRSSQGDDGGNTGRAVMAQVLRRVREGR
jgi:hypothetical protein